jgi:hypothetical protein
VDIHHAHLHLLLPPARDADRTSRILASLMAAAQGANNRTEAPSNRQTLNVTNIVAAAAGAMEAVADSNTPAGRPGGMALLCVALGKLVFSCYQETWPRKKQCRHAWGRFENSGHQWLQRLRRLLL